MLFDVFCKQGKLQVLEEGILRVMAPFNKLVWQVPCASITGFTKQPISVLAVNLAIDTTNGTHRVEMVSQANFKKLQALFPNLAVNTVQGDQHTIRQGKEWYYDLHARSHVATYSNEKQMQKEVEAAVQNGWMPQNTAGTSGHINVGRTTAAAVLTGGFSLLLGASRSKDKITITFTRTPEWLAGINK